MGVGERLTLGLRVLEEGTVVAVGDGVLRIEGLPSAAIEDVLQIGRASQALVLSLEPDAVLAVALDEGGEVREAASARVLHQGASLQVGDGLLGRVIDPLGRALDGVPLPAGLHSVPLERAAPAIHERAAVHSPLYTGTLAIDAMFAIGRGQRELILGEEGTGKTSLALDAMLRQRDTGVIAVYVAIGRRRAETWQVVQALREGGVRFVVVSAPEDAPPGLRSFAPYAGAAVAEYFARRGEHALVVYDDLTAHAVAWRELSLLLRRPPGREAYPGDVFYLHARLLERAAQLSPELGGGSITALPLATLEAGRLTAYIPTNLISITDGQVVLSRSLFAAGQKPAIDASLSVSRIGAKAQSQAMKELAVRMRLDYAGFLELEAFARLGTRLEESTRRRIERGRRIRALLRAQRLRPLTVFEEVARLILANDESLLLRLPEAQIEATAGRFVARARIEVADVVDRVERTAVLSEVDQRALSELAHRIVASVVTTGDPT